MRECSVANAETFSANQIILRQCMFTVVFIVDKPETCSCVMITRKAGPKGQGKVIEYYFGKIDILKKSQGQFK